MIYTETGLKKTQEMLTEMEQALNRLRRETQPGNEQKYSIMSQGLISQIRQMRAEVDEYIGLVPFNSPVLEQQVPAYA